MNGIQWLMKQAFRQIGGGFDFMHPPSSVNAYLAGMQARQQRPSEVLDEARSAYEKAVYYLMMNTPSPPMLGFQVGTDRLTAELRNRKKLAAEVRALVHEGAQCHQSLVQVWERVLMKVVRHCEVSHHTLQFTPRFHKVLWDLCLGPAKVPELGGLLRSIGVNPTRVIIDLGHGDHLRQDILLTLPEEQPMAQSWRSMERNPDGTITNPPRTIILENMRFDWERMGRLVNGTSPAVEWRRLSPGEDLPEGVTVLDDMEEQPAVEVVADNDEDADTAAMFNTVLGLSVGAPGGDRPRGGGRLPDATESTDDVEDLIKEMGGLIDEDSESGAEVTEM